MQNLDSGLIKSWIISWKTLSFPFDILQFRKTCFQENVVSKILFCLHLNVVKKWNARSRHVFLSKSFYILICINIPYVRVHLFATQNGGLSKFPPKNVHLFYILSENISSETAIPFNYPVCWCNCPCFTKQPFYGSETEKNTRNIDSIMKMKMRHNDFNNC